MSDELTPDAQLESTEPATDDHALAQPDQDSPPPVTEDFLLILNAMGMAWTAYQLYPDPTETPSWARAVESFRSSEAYPMYAEVSQDQFVSENGPIEVQVDGVGRLARALFVHEVAAISLPAPPTDGDLVRFFEILHTDPGEVTQGGGVRAMLSNSGVSTIEAVSRGPLEESDDWVEAGRADEVKEILDDLSDPRALAQRVMADGGGDVDRVTERFTYWFEEVLDKVAPEDYMARETVVTTFVEAFFHLEPDYKLAIIEFCLASRTKPAYQTLLDQFSGHDLASMASNLSTESRDELHDYARGSMDDGRPDELLEMLQSASEVEAARQAVAARITELLDEDGPQVGRGATFARIRAEIGALTGQDGVGKLVLRELLAIEERDARFRRLLRVWTGKMSRAIHDGNLDDAAEWLDAGLDDPTWEERRATEVSEALAAMANDSLITALVSHYADGELPPVAVRLIEEWGPTVTGRLVEQLADEEDVGRRRALIEVLASISRTDASGLTRYLSDKRWYLVRNVAIALGKTGRVEVAPRLRALASSHSDHRVRVEALRSLIPISQKQGIAASISGLSDTHKRVRQASVALLSAVEGANADEALGEALSSKSVPTESKLRVVEILSERSTPSARAALEAVAAKRSFLGAARAVRQAAQQALKGMT